MLQINTGYTIGNYQIETLLHQGRSSTLYLAFHRDTQEKVAIKVLDPLIVAPYQDTLIPYLQKNIQIVSRISHIGIPKYYEFNQYQNLWYIVMEYVYGYTLDQILQNVGILP